MPNSHHSIILSKTPSAFLFTVPSKVTTRKQLSGAGNCGVIQRASPKDACPLIRCLGTVSIVVYGVELRIREIREEMNGCTLSGNVRRTVGIIA